MRRIFSFLICFFLCQAGASAQMMGDAVPNTPEWQLSLDVIKSKAQMLMKKNIQLMDEYNALLNKDKDLQVQIRDWQIKNENLKELLKNRHGRSDQQIRIEELNNQIKSKKDDVVRQQKAVVLLQKQADGVDHILKLKRLKISDLELRQRQEKLKANTQKAMQEQSTLIVSQEELVQLQKKWQDEKDKQSALEKQLNDLKQAQASPGTVPTEEEGIKPLELRIQELTMQKEGLQNKNNVDNNPIKDKHVQELISKKRELEDRIKAYEAQLNQLKKSTTSGMISGGQKKQILRQVVEMDNRNAKLRQRITDLREDILLLRDQVNRLERKVNFTRGAEEKKK